MFKQIASYYHHNKFQKVKSLGPNAPERLYILLKSFILSAIQNNAFFCSLAQTSYNNHVPFYLSFWPIFIY